MVQLQHSELQKNRFAAALRRRKRRGGGYGGGRDHDVFVGVKKGVTRGGLDAVEVVIGDDLPVHGVENVVDSNHVSVLGG